VARTRVPCVFARILVEAHAPRPLAINATGVDVDVNVGVNVGVNKVGLTQGLVRIWEPERRGVDAGDSAGWCRVERRI